MTFSVEWYDDTHTVLLIEFGTKLTVEEQFAAIDATVNRMDMVTHTVDLITDYSDLRSIPSGYISSMRRIGSHPIHDHPNIGLNILLLRKGLYAELGRVFVSMFNLVRIVDDMDAAFALIEQARAARAGARTTMDHPVE